MRQALVNLNTDFMVQYPDYVARVTSDEGAIGRGHLSNFQDLERRTPAILTSSQLLTTGVDAPTCKNVVLARVVGSMSEFKQIIGGGTRLRDDYGKLWFNIIDYTGSWNRRQAPRAGDIVLTREAPVGHVCMIPDGLSEAAPTLAPRSAPFHRFFAAFRFHVPLKRAS